MIIYTAHSLTADERPWLKAILDRGHELRAASGRRHHPATTSACPGLHGLVMRWPATGRTLVLWL